MSDTKPAEAELSEDGKNQSIFELIDEVIRIDRGTLTKILAVCVTVLLLISGSLVYQEVAAGRSHLAAVYGGFFLLVLGLIASAKSSITGSTVAFVLHEASQLESTQVDKKSQ